jgi:hypothetical protein
MSPDEVYSCTHLVIGNGILRMENRRYGQSDHVISIPIDRI